MSHHKLLLLMMILVMLIHTTFSTLTVHVVPHSHCDPGWLYTIEEYYENAVVSILNGMVESLVKHSDRKFVWAEVSYFSMWWNRNATQIQKQQVHHLLENKQLEFVIGGWVMNDQAVTTYSSNIDQMTHGHRFLIETFGHEYRPRTGWDIDPFGISMNVIHMYQQMGFDYNVIARIDWISKSDYIEEHGMERQWLLNHRNNNSLLTHIMYDSYCTPSHLDFEGSYPNGYNPQINGHPITHDNILYYAQLFYNITMERSTAYPSPINNNNKNHFLFPFGCDFEFREPERNFGNMTLIMNYINSHPELFHNMTVKYSLVTEYFDQIVNMKQFPIVETGSDYFPYFDNSLSYWTGFYTSRPTLKKLARESESIARSAELLLSLVKNKSLNTYNQMYSLRSANGYLQHHDAITGTERDHVVNMYENYIENGWNQVKNVFDTTLSQFILSSSSNMMSLSCSFHHNRLVNRMIDLTHVKWSQWNDLYPIVLFNSLGWSRSVIVQLRLSVYNVNVLNVRNETVPFHIAKWNESYVITLESGLVPAIGIDTLFIQYISHSTTTTTRTTRTRTRTTNSNEKLLLSNPVYDIYFTVDTNRLCRIVNKQSNIDIPFEQDLLQYTSYAHDKQQSSGAYIFRTGDNGFKTPILPLNSTLPTITINSNDYIQQIEQQFSSFAKQTIRLYNYKNKSNRNNHVIEFEFMIGEIELNREIITSFKSNSIHNNRYFYTDSNAFNTMERQYDQFPVNPVTNSYLPTQYSSFIRSSDQQSIQLTVLSDQSRGVSSQENGQLEYMLHRRTSRDDWRGLERPLNDTTEHVSIVLRVIIDRPETSTLIRRVNSYEFNYPMDMFTFQQPLPPFISTIHDYTSFYKSHMSSIQQDLPFNIHLLTLQVNSEHQQQEQEQQLLLRLHHIFEENEHSKSDKVVIHLDQLLSKSYRVHSVYETKLSGYDPQELNSPTIVLYPGQIRTFLFIVSSK